MDSCLRPYPYPGMGTGLLERAGGPLSTPTTTELNELNREGWSETKLSQAGDWTWKQWSTASTSGERDRDGRIYSHLIVHGTEQSGWSGSLGFSIDFDLPQCTPLAATPKEAAAALEQLRDSITAAIRRVVADARRRDRS